MVNYFVDKTRDCELIEQLCFSGYLFKMINGKDHHRGPRLERIGLDAANLPDKIDYSVDVSFVYSCDQRALSPPQ